MAITKTGKATKSVATKTPAKSAKSKLDEKLDKGIKAAAAKKTKKK